MTPSPASPPDRPARVAHLLGPAGGEARAHVRALLSAASGGALLLAPTDTLASFADAAVPSDAGGRHALKVGTAPGGLEMARAGVEAGRWARARGATLLHGHGLRLAPLFWAASRASGLPLVVTLHGPVRSGLPLPLRAALRRVLGHARRVIAVSRVVAHSARCLLASEDIAIVFDGVDAGRFVPQALPARDYARAALGLDQTAAVALCSARLSREKNVGGFLETAALVAPHLPQARFLVAGEGPLLPILRHQVAFLGLEGRAVLLGRQDDDAAPTLLAASDLFCVPARSDGLSLGAVLEAMAAGLPVVGTRAGALPEAVEDGATGLMAPPGDLVALARALRQLLSDGEQARGMGEAGRARVRAHFRPEQMLEATFRVYDEALTR